MCSHTTKCCPKMADYGLLALRVIMGVIFIYSGYIKLANPAMMIGMFSALHFPAPTFWNYLVALTELIGGIMVLLGVYARYAAAVLSFVMLVAIILLAKMSGFNLMTIGYPLACMGGLLALAGVGAGKYRVLKSECCCKKCKAGMNEGGCCKDDGTCECKDKK